MTCCALSLPAEITAGLSFQATINLADYQAPVWALHIVIRGPSAIDISETSNSDGAHVFDVPAATTATWLPGAYWYSIRASKAGSLVEVEKGQLTVLPDLANLQAGYDGRSQNQIALDAINAVLAKRATRDQQRYIIDKRELWRTPIPELLKLRAFYAVQVRRECARTTGKNTFGRAVHVRFSRL